MSNLDRDSTHLSFLLPLSLILFHIATRLILHIFVTTMMATSRRAPPIITKSTVTAKVTEVEVTPQTDDLTTTFVYREAPSAIEVGALPRTHNKETEWEQTSTRLAYETEVAEKPRDDGLHGIDKLVHDLLATHKSLEEEKRKVAERDAEIARLKERVAHLLEEAREDMQKRETAETKAQELERMSELQSKHDEEVNELRRLLAFHKTNGEQVSRQCRELQATNKGLQVSLKANEMMRQEQAALLSGLRLQANEGDS